MIKLLAGGSAAVVAVPVLLLAGAGASVEGAPPPPPSSEGQAAPAGASDLGGDLETQVLASSNIKLRGAARADVQAGTVDPRILKLLLVVSAEHSLGSVGPFSTGHSYYVRGTNRVSNHVFGRAVDISVVDGKAVNAGNAGAMAVLEIALSVPAEFRPDEVGAPWRVTRGSVTTFTKAHGDHLHFGIEKK